VHANSRNNRAKNFESDEQVLACKYTNNDQCTIANLGIEYGLEYQTDLYSSKSNGGRAGVKMRSFFDSPTDCSPFCLISRQGDSETAISVFKALESRQKCKRQPCPWYQR
jgi:hypothetical protein